MSKDKLTDLDYRKAALHAAITWDPDARTADNVVTKAAIFETYLRNGQDQK